MSSRFLKKISKVYDNNKEDFEEEVDVDENGAYTSNKFNLLILDSTDSDEQDQIEKQTSKIKDLNIKSQQKPEKNKFTDKKKKKRDKFEDMDEDEIMDMFSCMESATVNREHAKSSKDVLTLKIRFLNENLELQQLFGTPVDLNDSRNGRNRQRNQNALLKNNFGKRNVNWPNTSFSKLGLQMEPSKKDSPWYIVTCTKDYLQAEKALKTVMRTGNFQDHLREYPYHVNTLLQMSVFLINQEDFTLAADLYKRIFYVYETITPMGMSLLGSNTEGSLSKKGILLDYRYRLNRGIFIALFKWIQYLCQKSCFNTALEYCKVLLKINVDCDPLAVVLMIDNLAIRCDQYDFLIEFYDQFREKKALKYLPNFALSMPLCYYFKYLHKKIDADLLRSNELLQQALCLFPTFVAIYAEECNIQVDNVIQKSQIFSAKDDPASLSTMLQLYSKRSINFWKNPSIMSWVEENAHIVLGKFESDMDGIKKQRKGVIEMYGRQIPLPIKRHLALSGYVELAEGSSYATTNNLQILTFDPFPPVNSEGGFDHYLENETDYNLDDSWFINLIRSFSPSFGI